MNLGRQIHRDLELFFLNPLISLAIILIYKIKMIAIEIDGDLAPHLFSTSPSLALNIYM